MAHLWSRLVGAVLLLTLTGCGRSLQTWVPVPAAGTSLKDMWGVGNPQDNDPDVRGRLFHFDGTAWTRVSLPTIDAAPNRVAGVASAGTGDAWVLGGTTEVAHQLSLVRVDPTGQKEDHSAELVGANDSTGWIMSGRGGVFVVTWDPTPQAYSLKDGHFVALAGVPADLGPSTPLAAVGPDEFYLQAATRFVHVKAGAFSDVPYVPSGLTQVAASSSTDVWFWVLANNSGGAGFHGTGDEWSEFSVLGWPVTSPDPAPSPLLMLSKGPGDLRLLANHPTGSGSNKGNALISMSLDSKGQAGAPQTLVPNDDCPDTGCSGAFFTVGARLDDGTVLVSDGRSNQTPGSYRWYVVNP